MIKSSPKINKIDEKDFFCLTDNNLVSPTDL